MTVWAGAGTEVILKLREDDKEFLEPSRLSFIVRRYSDHIGLPIRLRDVSVRLDYRVFSLRGTPLHKTVHRVYAGVNLRF